LGATFVAVHCRGGIPISGRDAVGATDANRATAIFAAGSVTAITTNGCDLERTMSLPGRARPPFRRKSSSQKVGRLQSPLFVAAFIALVSRPLLAGIDREPIRRSTFPALGIDSSLALLNGDVFVLQRLPNQSLIFLAHPLL
jgi:hypothetical protein